MNLQKRKFGMNGLANKTRKVQNLHMLQIIDSSTTCSSEKLYMNWKFTHQKNINRIFSDIQQRQPLTKHPLFPPLSSATAQSGRAQHPPLLSSSLNPKRGAAILTNMWINLTTIAVVVYCNCTKIETLPQIFWCILPPCLIHQFSFTISGLEPPLVS